MSNRNRNLATTGTNETKETGKVKDKLVQINWKGIGKTAGKIAVGFCALVGAAGLGSYAADRIQAPRTPKGVPDNKVGEDNLS